MSKAVRVQLKPKDQDLLQRRADSLGVSVEQAAAILLQEKVREMVFPELEFRDSAVGRQVYVKGERLTVWQVVMVARDFGADAVGVAEHLETDPKAMEAALAYAAAYPEEIDPILDYVESFTFEDLKRIIPSAREIRV